MQSNWPGAMIEYMEEIRSVRRSGTIVLADIGLVYLDPVGKEFPVEEEGNHAYVYKDEDGKVRTVREISEEDEDLELEPQLVMEVRFAQQTVKVHRAIMEPQTTWLDFDYDDPWGEGWTYRITDKFDENGNYQGSFFMRGGRPVPLDAKKWFD